MKSRSGLLSQFIQWLRTPSTKYYPKPDPAIHWTQSSILHSLDSALFALSVGKIAEAKASLNAAHLRWRESDADEAKKNEWMEMIDDVQQQVCKGEDFEIVDEKKKVYATNEPGEPCHYDRLRCRRIEIVDKNGRNRIILAVSDEGVASIWVSSTKGSAGVRIAAHPDLAEVAISGSNNVRPEDNYGAVGAQRHAVLGWSRCSDDGELGSMDLVIKDDRWDPEQKRVHVGIDERGSMVMGKFQAGKKVR
jgi:hypothetical protein